MTGQIVIYSLNIGYLLHRRVMKKIHKHTVKAILSKSKFNKSLKASYQEYVRLTNDSLHINTFRRYVKNVLRYSYKYDSVVSKNKYNINNLKIGALVLNYYMKVLLDNQLFLYLDETGFDQKRQRLRRWSKRGHQIVTKSPNKSKNISVLVINSTKEVVYSKAIGRAFTADSFHDALLEFLDSKAFLKLHKTNQVVLYLDNAAIHKSEKIITTVRGKGLNMLYGIPYFPELNLTENVFSKIKRDYYRIEARQLGSQIKRQGSNLSHVRDFIRRFKMEDNESFLTGNFTRIIKTINMLCNEIDEKLGNAVLDGL
jgi:transposase